MLSKGMCKILSVALVVLHSCYLFAKNLKVKNVPEFLSFVRFWFIFGQIPGNRIALELQCPTFIVGVVN